MFRDELVTYFFTEINRERKQIMAIKLMPFVTLVLRTQVEQNISAEGWRYLLSHCDPHRNFDGEIIVFGAMDERSIDRHISELTSFGFIGPDQGEESDMVVFVFGSASQVPGWLSLVDVTFFDASIKPCKAWKLTKSEQYRLVDFHTPVAGPTKGYECDWEPKIGPIRRGPAPSRSQPSSSPR
jgi:hypothetical protein